METPSGFGAFGRAETLSARLMALRALSRCSFVAPECMSHGKANRGVGQAAGIWEAKRTNCAFLWDGGGVSMWDQPESA